MAIQSWIRNYNYSSGYFQFAYQQYLDTYPGYPVTYYSLDFENSVMDKETLMSGSYEKYGLGSLSGLKWKKIIYLPVFGVEQIQPMYDTSEKGLTLGDSETTQIHFPSEYGIKATEWDFVVFDQNYMQKDNNIKPVFVVTAINLAHYGDYFNIYQCRLHVITNRIQLEKQISGYYMFVEFTKKIHTLDNANVLLKLQKKNQLLYEKTIGLFYDSLGIYTQTKEVI